MVTSENHKKELGKKKKKEERERRIAKGLCRYCAEKALPGHKRCGKHYIVDAANKNFGKGNAAIAEILLQRFKENPFCPYTGEKLVLGENAHLDHIKPKKNHPELKGDIENIEWVSEQANLSKSGFDKDEFIAFCKLVSSRFPD